MDCLYLVEKAVLVCPYVRELDAAPFFTSVSVVPADFGVFVCIVVSEQRFAGIGVVVLHPVVDSLGIRLVPIREEDDA
jgi:hypothetical protein